MKDDYIVIINKSNNSPSINNVEELSDEKAIIDDDFIFVYEGFKGDKQQKYTINNDEFLVLFDGDCFNFDELKKKATLNDEPIELPMLFINLFLEYHTEFFALIKGKFTIIIWDKKTRTLYGARDHFGIKPLFYYEKDGTFVFSSSKNSINKVMAGCELNIIALQQYFSFQYVPEPLTLNNNIKMVEPGTSFIKKKDNIVEFSRFWRANFNPIIQDKSLWTKKIRKVMQESIEARMGGNKEIGSLLSGGIDSTLVVALAKEINPNIKTFSVGFEKEGYSEVSLAKETAKELKVENISKIITADEYVEKIPEIIWYLEEPLADPSCIPLYFAAKEVSKHLDIVLSGEGADEIFGGYNIYREPTSLNIFNYIPDIFKRVIKSGAKKLPKHMSGKSFLIRGTTPLHERYIGNAKMFEEDEKSAFLKQYEHAVSYNQITKPFYQEVVGQPLVSQMQYIDINTWLRGDILLKAEKMAIANGVEVRMPFLDPTVFELGSSIPVDLKISNNTTKYILREASRGIVPDVVLNRKKLGFPVPIRHWLKNELNSWAKNVIFSSHVDEYIDKQYVLNLLDKHCEGNVDFSRKIWTFLMFMIWHQVFVEEKV